jgi:LuxR family transcriptional regulator, quorum-sensing system regulator BjaR1
MDRVRFSFALKCINAIDRVDDADALMAALSEAADYFGFGSFAIATVPSLSGDFRRHNYGLRWPKGWFEHYVKRNHPRHDPILRYTRQTAEPFAWSEVMPGRDLTDVERAVMNEATDFKLTGGFVVPIHTPSGDLGLVTYGGSGFDMSLADRRALQLISIFAANKIHQIVGPTPPIPKLAPREIEILKWFLDGKTNRDIGDILKISDRTVETHFANACQKLGVVTRTQAVVAALQAGLIP